MTAPAERIWVLRDPSGAMVRVDLRKHAVLFFAFEKMGIGMRDRLNADGHADGYTLTLEAHPRPSEVPDVG